MKDEILRDYAGRYWNLGNAVTAFSMIQGIAFLTSIGSRERWVCELHENALAEFITLGWIVSVAAGSAFFVWQTSKREKDFISRTISDTEFSNSLLIMKSGFAKCSVILIFTVAQIGILLSGKVNDEIYKDCLKLHHETYQISTDKHDNNEIK